MDFEREAQAIHGLCGEGLRLHHIGSTAVPGLWAKDCIDILGVLTNPPVPLALPPKLQALGYQHKGAYGIPGRDYYAKTQRKVHLHVYRDGSPQIQPHLTFVRTLNDDASLRSKLNQLKQNLQQQHPQDKAAYQAAKASFYQQFSAQA